MAKPIDAVVIGAGIVGVSTALHLQMRGKKVLLIDRRGIGLETSYGNSGIIETSYVLPFALPPKKRYPRMLLNLDTAVRSHYSRLPRFLPWIADFYAKSQTAERMVNGRLLRPLIAPALDEHRVLMQGTDAERHLTSHGRVKLHRTEASYESGVLERRVANELGVPFEVMDPLAFSAIEPSLNPIYYKAVRWSSSARLTDPGAVVAAYAERFIRDGGAFQQVSVESLCPLPKKTWNVQTNEGAITTKHVVICTGPWAADLYKSLGYAFPLGLKRGYHQHFAAKGSAKLSYALVDADIGYLICPMEQGYRITTGIEFAGIDDPSTPVQISRVLPYARELFPLGDAVEPNAWYGHRPCFADSLPLIEEARKHQGLWFNFGHGHSGLTIGPSSGRLLAEMMTGKKTFCDPAAYSSRRFG
jgi:D-amino-acid dehydrogenase